MKTHTLQRVGPGLVVALVAVLLSAMALPASADGHTGTTSVTFEVTAAGGLAITVPASVDLGTTTTGGSLNASLGEVRVDDTRGALLSGYTATVSSTDFTTGDATEAETLAAAAVAYTGGVVVPGGAVLCASLLVDAALSATPEVAMNATAATGTNSCTWTPTIDVTLPAATVAGVYTGTITHSVA